MEIQGLFSFLRKDKYMFKLTKYGNMDVMLHRGAFMPEKTDDPGEVYYIRTPRPIWIDPHDSCTIDTGIYANLPDGCVGYLRSITGACVRTIDETRIDNTGNKSILVTMHCGDIVECFRKGDVIAELVILPSPHTPELEKQYPTTVYKIEIRRAQSGKQYLVLCTKDEYVILDDDGYPEKLSTDIAESLTLVESLNTTLFYDREF